MSQGYFGTWPSVMPCCIKCANPLTNGLPCEACEAAVMRAARALFGVRFADMCEADVAYLWEKNDRNCQARFREAVLALRDVR